MYSDRIRGVAFSAHTSEEIRTLAVKRIVNPETYDQLLHPNSNGLYDLDLGPNDNDDRCGTCGMNSMKCPGHFGYIELPLPVYHPMFFKLMIQILSGSCFKCHRLTAKMSRIQLFIRQCELIDKGYFIEAVSLGDMYGFFVFEASEGIKSEASLQKAICDKIDAYYTDVEKQSDYRKVECTKNLTNFKQSLITEFIKVHLKSKTKECPHCKSLLRTIRSEYNVRVYFKSASHKAVQKAINQKMVTDLKGESKQRKSGDVHGIGTADDIIDCEEYQDAEGEIEDEDENPEQLKSKLSEQEYITPEEVKKHMIQLWNTNDKALKCLLGSFNDPERKKKVTTPEIFFLDAIAVPPSKFRPLSYMGEKRFENPQTANLNKILWFCKLINEILIQMKDNEIKDFAPVIITGNEKSYKAGNITVPGKSYSEQLQNAWIELQTDVNTFMDNSLSKLASSAIPGVKQLLEKKEGLFRKHMMGKRVNYACRSVISPDPYINTDEIGVPLIFAKKLTYVQPVTVWNLEQLTQMVINGPDKYPGAVMIEYEDGRKTKLSQNEVERRAVAKQLLSSSVGGGKIFQGKKIHRHLVDGDVLLLNRQPSLHKASIMAHKAKVLTNERTLRLHYANCKSYNADFDGDEMNAHFPQNELGRAEAYHLVSTNFNYLGPKDGKPLAGLIQDHIVAGVNMTARDCFFSREDYQQLVYSGLIDAPSYVKTLPPCIIKPVPLWSGKQVFSTLLLNVIPANKKPPSMNSGKVKISDGNWPKRKGRSNSENYHSAHSNDPFLTESQVIIREGQLLTGILDKTQYGAVPYSLVHSVYELYGGKISGKLLSVLSKVFTAYLQQHTGFTLGVEDIIVQPHAEAKRRELINEGRLCGDEAAMEALNVSCDGGELKEKLLEAHHSNHGIALQQLDLSMKSRTDSINNKVNSTCIKGLLKKFPSNSLQLMAISGAKGSSVNCMQISCLLGQIELEGRRPPLSMSGRSLPSFLPYDTSPRAGGFVDGRFLTGIQPQEYFFHCMAGREGLVDTAVKTSRSGYLQRCLMKHLESLLVQYDMTVRDGDGSVVQFLYGDDGMDVLKNQYMHKNQFKAIAQNYEAYVSLLKPSEVSNAVDIKKAPKMQRKCDRWKKRHNKTFSSKYSHNQIAPFFLFHQENCRSMKEQYPSLERHLGRTAADENLISNWIKSDGPSKENYITHCLPCPDPILSQLNPTSHFGAVSEKFMDDIKEYIKLNPDGLLTEDEDEEKVSSSTFLPLMLIKYMRSMVEPGEAVGVLAGQAIGEPSTQMTLNTFHFAGRGEVNVTLGIPRLREILMTASPNIKTPQMDVLVRSGEEKAAKRIAKKINRITLMDVLHHVSVSESLQRSYLDKVTRCRQFTIRLEFLPLHSYEHDYDVTPAKIMDYVETVFIRQITSYVSKIIRTKQKLELLNSRADDTHVVRSAEDGDVEEQNQIAPEEPDDEADLSDEDAGDGDIMNMKERNKQTQFTSYDDPVEQQKELDQDNEDNALLEEIHIKGEPMNYDDYEQSFSEGCDESAAIEKEEGKKGLKLDPRIANVLKRERHLTKYLVDDDNKWCEFTLQFPLAGSKVMLISVIEKLAEKAVVSEAAGIKKAVIIESKLPNETGRLRLKTEGANIPEFCNYDNIFDLNSLYCNNIHEVEKHYGIEAARAAIIKEVQDVFKVYGIQIDPRHLSLVADYMTFEGTYKPFNRHAIETNSSPFQKMSFETSMNFLRSATAFGQPDDLGSPSSRIVVGRVIGQGTGLMDLVPKLSV